MNDDYCQFCSILTKNEPILYSDQQFFAFHDIDKASAVQHVLVCTKDHIQSALKIKNPQTLWKMRYIGEKVLRELRPQATKFRFGFHIPPTISVHHIHLHCFVLPFQSIVMEKFKYGYLLKSVKEIQRRIMESRPRL